MVVDAFRTYLAVNKRAQKMKTQEWRTKDWIAMIFAGALATIAMLTIVPGWTVIWRLVSAEGASAWVQAIGSIAAILVSAGVVIWQHRLELQRQREAAHISDFAVLNGILWTLQAIDMSMEKVMDWARKPHPDGAEIWFHHGVMKSHLAALAQRDVVEIPSRDLVFSLMEARAVMEQFVDVVEQMKKFMSPEAGQKYGLSEGPFLVNKFKSSVKTGELAVEALRVK